jgi:tryptophan synthase beta chain
VNLSGRGDKDVDTAARWFNLVSADDLVQTEAERVAVVDEELSR